MEITRKVTVPRPIGEVFTYLADFTHTEEWDPGTVRTTRQEGDGGVGTRYHNVSRFLGRETELTYVVTELSEPANITLRGENETVVAHDDMSLAATSEGTTITYRATFDFKGIARFMAPLLYPALRHLGNEAEKGLQRALA